MKEVRAALWGVWAFGAAYLGMGTLHPPALTYDPLARTLAFAAGGHGLSMRYYGDLLWACTAAFIAALAALRRPSASRSVRALTAAALSVVALDVAWYLSPLFGSV